MLREAATQLYATGLCVPVVKDQGLVFVQLVNGIARIPARYWSRHNMGSRLLCPLPENGLPGNDHQPNPDSGTLTAAMVAGSLDMEILP